MKPGTGRSDDWWQPGPVEVAPDVHRIPLPLPNDALKAVNVYCLASNDGMVLIDSGWAVARAREQLTRSLANLGYSLADVDRFLVTHVHRDHYTQAVLLRREFGTRVSLGVGEKASLRASQRAEVIPMDAQLQRLHRLGASDLANQLEERFRLDKGLNRSNWEDPDDWIEPGEQLTAGGRSLEVVATPGHTQGHVVFYDTPAGLLFSGDHVLPTITPSIGFEPAPSPSPLRDFLGSLATVRRRADAVLLPAHGPVAASVHARVDELTDHHDQRLRRTEEAVARGAVTAYEVAGQLTWTRRDRRFSDLDPFNQMLATLETAAHLDLLVAQGRAKVDGSHEVLEFWSN